MLKVLIVAGCFSIIVDMAVSSPEARKVGKCSLNYAREKRYNLNSLG